MTTSATRLRANEVSAQFTQALINASARGIRPRCSDPGWNYWMSDDESDRAQAVQWCTGCLVLAECREVGRYQTFGVYGGVDRTVRQKAA